MRSAGRWLLLLLFVATGFSSFAQSIFGPDYVYVNISKSPTGATSTFGAQNAASAPDGPFNGANLGSYALGSSGVPDEQLLFNGGNLTTSEPTSSNPNMRIKSAQLYYRVYLQSSGSGNVAFTSLELPEDLSATIVSGGTTKRTFTLTNTGTDLVSGVSGNGLYTIELYLQANYQNGGTTLTPVLDNRGGINYIANFIVTGSRQNTTIWNGTTSDNWFDATNWSAGVPTATIDAYIRYPNPGAIVPYPRIYANSHYQLPVGSTSTLTYNQNSGSAYSDAVVHNLSFGGYGATARATMELVTGNLLIYGDFTNNFDNITQDMDTYITFASTTAQAITGGGSFKRVHIAGGGVKTLTGNMKIATDLNFGPPTNSLKDATPVVTGKGILAVAGGSSNNVVTLQAITSTSVATITNESDTGYVSGLVATQAETVPGIPQTFGDIGITLTFAGNSPGVVSINRTTNQYFTVKNKANGYSIKRSYEVLPANPNTANGGTGLNAELKFNYLDTDGQNVGTNNVNFDESQFVLLYTANATSFTDLGYTTRNTTDNYVTKSNVTSFAIFTLVDATVLPVTLVAFDAKRLGDASVLTWTTAMESGNRGFDIEVSTDGLNYRTLGFVGSNAGNSSSNLSYSYTDKEANKAGIRYYRLHQIDYSGKGTYSPVRAVSFAAAGAEVAALSAYPNPFTSDEIKLALQSSEAGPATLHLTDLMGRQISTQTFAAAKGVTEVSIDQASALAAGSYLAQITAPSGEVKTVRIQKR